MSSARTRANAAHKAAPAPARIRRRLVGVTTLLTSGIVAVGVLSGGAPASEPSPSVVRASLGSVTLTTADEPRTQRLSRTAQRVKLKPRPVAYKYAQSSLKLRTAPNGAGSTTGWIGKGKRVATTGQVTGTWAEVLVGKRVRWTDVRLLASTKPKPKPKPKPEPQPEPEPESQTAAKAQPAAASDGAGGGLSTAPCPAGSSIESGITSSATAVYRAVCAAFPQPQTYGGYDPHGEHVDGRAIDIMVTGELGSQIAEWLRANAGALGIRNVIWAQQIWSSERSGEGWRSMEDRGSTTANHYDHVHVAVH